MLDAALAALRREDPISLTKRLVEVNSFTENVAGVNTVGKLLEEAFGFLQLERKSSTRFGDHLIWTTRKKGPRILLVGHHDTVFPIGHFEGWRVDGDRATGPGALDMKGGLAVIHAALRALDAAGVLHELPLAVISVTDEEVGSPDSTPHLKELAQGARCALVFESGREKDLIVTRRRGVGQMKVVATGKAAHAGNHHKDGANAIWALAKFVDAAQKLTDYSRGLTVNVGTIKGGSSKNTVPAEAECAIDLRFETVPDAEKLVAALRAIDPQVPGTTLKIDGGISRLPLEQSSTSRELFLEYAACQRAAGLGDGEAPLVGGGSDANTTGGMGIPSIDGLGPRGQGFHTTTEYVELSSFIPKAEALVRFLCNKVV